MSGLIEEDLRLVEELFMNRQDRRKANRGKPKAAVTVSREIFTTPNLGDKVVKLDIGRMRVWAEKNVELQKMEIVAEHVKWLVEGGTVEADRMMNHTIHQIPKPILACECPDAPGDEIVDGNHTYVATALSWAKNVEQGMISPEETPFVVGYGLTPAQWRQFVVTASQLRKLR
jgi:hypothetical protein